MLPIRVLLVDDNPEFLGVAARLLATDRRLVITGRALSGRDALEQVALLRPDLVLMDLAMPGMNGLEATRRIKAQPDAPRVVMLTLHDNPEYRAAAAAVGVDGFVTKPEFSTQLGPLIHTLFIECQVEDKVEDKVKIKAEAESIARTEGGGRRTPQTSVPCQARGPATMPAASILVVDDEVLICLWLKQVLAGDGHQVVAVESGEAALELVTDQRFDLVLTDLDMNGMGGIEVLAALRQQSPDTALIVFTAEASPEVAAEALHQGAHDFLCKPCRLTQLRESVRTGLNLHQRQLRQQEWLVQLEGNPDANVEYIRTTVVERSASPAKN